MLTFCLLFIECIAHNIKRINQMIVFNNLVDNVQMLDTQLSSLYKQKQHSIHYTDYCKKYQNLEPF